MAPILLSPIWPLISNELEGNESAFEYKGTRMTQDRIERSTLLRCIMSYGCLLLIWATPSWADTPPVSDQVDIGIFTAVEGKVAVTHPGIQTPIPAKIQEGVLFKDVIETDRESRSKALLNDDSILTVGEHSRVEITEHIYDPNKGVRSVVLNLVKGKVRALVGKAFTGSGSKFEIHTPTAVAAARGTYFIVFHVNGVSGITNVGTHGHVDFSSGGKIVPVPPGHYSVTPPGGGAPSPPTVNTGSGVPQQVANAVQGTEVKDSPKEESPKQTAMASGGTAPVPSSPSNLSITGSSGTGAGSSGTGGTGGTGGGGSSTSSTLTVTSSSPAPSPPIIPSTTSGAVSTSGGGGSGDDGTSGGGTGGGGTGDPPPTSPPPTNPPPAEPPAPPPAPPTNPPPPTVTEALLLLTNSYTEKTTKSVETFEKLIGQPGGGQSPEAHATNVIRQVYNAGATYLADVKALGLPQELVTQAEMLVTNTQNSTVQKVTNAGFVVTSLPPGTIVVAAVPPPSPPTSPTPPSSSPSPSPEPDPSLTASPTPPPSPSPPPPTASIGEWFTEVLAKLFDRFEKFIASVDQKETKAFARAESEYERRLRRADAKEQKLIDEALKAEAELVAKANEEYQKALQKLEKDNPGQGKGVTDLEKAQAKLQADLANAAEIREAAVARAKAIEEAKIAKAAWIQEARVLRAQALEAAKVDRSGEKLVQRVSSTGDQYLLKLRDAGASQAELDEARRQVNEKIAAAEERVRLAQQAAVQDDIVRRTTGIAQEREFIRKFGRISAEQRTFIQQQRQLNRQARLGQQELTHEQRQALRAQRELIKEQRKAIRQGQGLAKGKDK